MQYPKSPHPVQDRPRRPRHWAASALALAAMAAQASPAFATIDNTATATGTPPAGGSTTGTSNTVNVPVAPAAPSLLVSKSLAAPVDANADGVIKAGDTVAVTVTINNTGNVTMYNVAPVESGAGLGMTFGPSSTAGTGTLGAFSPATATIAPGASQIYTATYTLSNVDAFRGAGQTPAANSMKNVASATGNVATSGGSVISSSNVTNGTGTVLIPATPKITVVKSYVLTKTAPNAVAGQAEVSDTIAYKYEVTNEGNVTMANVSVSDTHEGAALPAGTVANETVLPGDDGPVGTSSDVTANNGTYSSLVAGAKATFTYTHTVNQTEFNNQ
ncbi:MAG: hypothetical protein U1E15_05855 [Hyphomicrobiales bacterium]